MSDIKDNLNITSSGKDVNTFCPNDKKVLKLNCEGTKGKKEVIK